MLLVFLNTSADSFVTIKGTVLDSITNKPISDVYVITGFNKYVVTDSRGNFNIENDTEINNPVVFRHMAYFDKRIEVDNLINAGNLYVLLSPKLVLTNQLNVIRRKFSAKNTLTGAITLAGPQLKEMPQFFGEPDVMNAVYALPGVQSANEGISGIFIRGGSAGQNSIYLDDIEIINPFHLLGAFSVFNPQLTDKITVFKGSAPVNIQSKVASSILVETKRSIDKPLVFNMNIGTIASNITVEGSSKNKRLYYGVGLRRTSLEYYKGIASLLIKEESDYFKSAMYGFYDFNTITNYRTEKGILNFSYYLGGDKFKYNLEKKFNTDLQWGNHGSSLSYKHQYNTNFYSEHLASFSNFHFNYSGEILLWDLFFETKYKKYNTKHTFFINQNEHSIHAGFEAINYLIIPQFLEASSENLQELKYDEYRKYNFRFFAGDTWSVTAKTSIYAGFNFDSFSDFNKTLQKSKPIITFSPTLHLSYKKNVRNLYKISFSKTHQNIHLGSIATIPLPADVWMPSTNLIEPESCQQITAEYAYTNNSKNIDFSISVFGRNFNNQLIFVPNFVMDYNESIEKLFYKGSAKSAGIELFYKTRIKKTTFQGAYTFSKTFHKFAVLNGNSWFDAKYDRPHDATLLITHNFSNKVKINLKWVLASGSKTTLPEQAYLQMGNIMFYNKEINNFRYPTYHRLDIGMDYYLKPKFLKTSVINFSITNLYNRSNPYFIFLEAYMGESYYNIDIKARQVSLFPILPSISWRISF